MPIKADSLITFCCFLCVDMIGATSSEADPLQQALVLVDLLKAEYARVNKENYILMNKEAMLRSTADQPTCPTTALVDENDELWLKDDERRAAGIPSRRLFSNLTPPPEHENTFKSRRLEYDDAFGPHPGGDASTTGTSTAISTNTSNRYRSTTSTSSTSVPSPPHTTPESGEITPSPTSTQQSTTAHTQLDKTSKKLKAPVKHDPVMEQVAVEIMNEMKDSKQSKAIKYASHSAPLLKERTKHNRFENLAKGTLKVHQATSRRHAIPLPENNAFCFFHPNNALCRTLI